MLNRTYVANTLFINENGTTNLGFTSGITSIQAEWASTGVAPAGTFTFLLDGDPGNSENVIDLSTTQRAIVSNTKLAFIDLTVAGFPTGGLCVLYFR